MNDEIMPDSRYPYTYACDLIRGAAGCNTSGTKISRADASAIYQIVAKAMGVAPAYVAECLANHYKANEAAITDDFARSFIAGVQP